MKARIWKTTIRAEKSYNFEECSMGDMTNTTISLHSPCSGSLRCPSSASNTVAKTIIIIISLCLQCSRGLHRSLHRLKYNRKHDKIVLFTMFRSLHGSLRRLKYNGNTQSYRHIYNVPEVSMVPPVHHVFQHNGKHNHTNIVAMFWRSSKVTPAPQIQWRTP